MITVAGVEEKGMLSSVRNARDWKYPAPFAKEKDMFVSVHVVVVEEKPF